MPLTTVSPGLLDSTAQYTGFKNRIINGAMVIDQRNNGASVTGNDQAMPVDRFKFEATQTGKLTGQRNAGSVTPPAGFTNYLGITSSSAYSVLSTDLFCIEQRIEGYNVADLAFGSASASTVTLSFWVRSSLTGPFGGALQNSAANRSYAFSYTISAANTWEYKTVTIVGDTTGTWLTDNGKGLIVLFSLGAGSNYSGAVGAWTASALFQPTGSTSVVGTSGATFYITGVQLEKGTAATSFDYRPYGTELQLCQRYYEKTYDMGVVPGTSNDKGAFFTVRIDSVGGGGTAYKVSKRATPTVTFYSPASGASGQARNYSTSADTAASPQSIGDAGFYVLAGSASNGQGLGVQWTASAEL